MSEIEPDTKDWTWVLQQPCPECGFDAAAVSFGDIAGRVREMTPRWQQRLAADDARDRPDLGTWSPTEYAAHVRDVYRVFDTRLEQMLTQDDPLFANWDQDATAIEDDYASQEPATVADELSSAATVISNRFDGVRPEQLTRPGRRSNGSVFTVDSLGRYFLHDVVHHLHDVQG